MTKDMMADVSVMNISLRRQKGAWRFFVALFSLT
jgi:hypothetical protein